MKLKLRKLRKKREFLAHWKGGFSKSYGHKILEKYAVVRRRGENTRLRRKEFLDFLTNFYFLPKLKQYYKFKIIPKAKKRGGKNR